MALAPMATPLLSPLRVAIAGLGTVGGGISQILHANRAVLAQRCGGRAIELVAVADQRPLDELQKAGVLDGHEGMRHFPDAVAMAEQCDADVIVETIGGYKVALDIAGTALRRGLSLVTANKALLATHGGALATAAEENGAKIGWEAAVGGGIPCIRALKEGCAANRVTYAAGILNGTCNFILSTMKQTGRGFEDVLAEAQARGYAETPPDLDVDGIDTAHKIALVAAVATGCVPDFDAVHIEGIREVIHPARHLMTPPSPNATAGESHHRAKCTAASPPRRCPRATCTSPTSSDSRSSSSASPRRSRRATARPR